MLMMMPQRMLLPDDAAADAAADDAAADAAAEGRTITRVRA